MAFSGLDPFKLTGIKLTKNELGTGSYASVYELNYLGLKCAGKKLHESLLKQGGGTTYALKRFEEECRLLSQMHHPNIVQFLGVYFEQGMQVPILVMEFLPYTLTSCIEKNGVLRSEFSYSIIHDVALGLNYLHSHASPIIHRDLSSNNVLLASNMKAKIADLGVAKIVNLTPLQVSRIVYNTQTPGTPAYMPPEALVAAPKYDKSIDVFSFGIMMIHVFSGKWPEPQVAPIRMEHDSDRMIPVSEAERREVFLTAVGNEHPMMNLIHQCISNNPKKRPTTSVIVPQLKDMVMKNPPSFSDRLQMLHQIETDRKSNEVKVCSLQSQIERLQLALKAATAKKHVTITQPISDQSKDVAGAADPVHEPQKKQQYIHKWHVDHGQAPVYDSYVVQKHVDVNLNLTVGSRIQIPTQSPTEPFKYGVIRWIGEISAVQGLVAGIEMDDYMEGCTDGTLISTGQKFFECTPGKAIYYPMVNLQPDEMLNPLDDEPLKVAQDQFTEGCREQIKRYIGDRKGIQGHQNSCYCDASIFGLFALTDAFDELFLKAESSKTADPNRQEIADWLWKGIVNPLRKNGIARCESMMALRTKLDELGKREGIILAEKDPEEFLNMLFKHTLKVDPFVTIRHPYGDEPDFFVQLFAEYNESIKLPTIGLLLQNMFEKQRLSFLQMPSRLLIRVPRSGRQFRTYEKIIPNLKLNVTNLTDEFIKAAPRCFICNARAEFICKACAAEVNKDGNLCSVCNRQFHSHPSRNGHVLDRNIGDGMEGSSLDLLSVICIETSHYVCFTKEPSDDPNKPPRWIFFDSLANIVYNKFNIPSINECSDVLNQWVYPANGDLSLLINTVPRDLPEYVRRFTQDLYLCVYVNTDALWYG